jgi:hypothetical protein
MRKYTGYLALDHDFIRSESMAALSPRAKLLVFGMADRFNGKNNGQISYSVKEAMQWLGCSKHSARAALDELQDARLIEVAVEASFDHKAGAQRGVARKWRLLFLRAKRRNLKSSETTTP